MTWRALCLTNSLAFRQGKCGPSSLAESLLSRQTRYQGCCCPFLEVQFWHSQISGIHCPCPMVQQGWQQARPEPCTECWVTELSSPLVGCPPWCRAHLSSGSVPVQQGWASPAPQAALPSCYSTRQWFTRRAGCPLAPQHWGNDYCTA